MRAHLIQTTNSERDDAQLDHAANDAQYERMIETAPTKAMTPLARHPAPIARLVAQQSTCDNDDYYLGGYAGI